MFLMEPVKFFLVVISFYAFAFSASAEKVFTGAVPLEADKAFVIDHMVTGPVSYTHLTLPTIYSV